jgi:hypothetical protein
MRINRYTAPAMLLATVAVAFMSVLLAVGTGVSLLVACCLVALIGKSDWASIAAGRTHRANRTHGSR